MRVQFQLTFEEYAEAIHLVRRQLLRVIRKRVRAEFWIGAVVVFAVIIAISNLLDRMIPQRTIVPLGESLRPYLFILLVVWLIVLALRLHIRRRMRVIDRVSFDGRPQLHQVRTIEFTDAGVTVSDPFCRAEYQWRIFRRLEETKNTFVLYVSEYTFEVIPKRVLQQPGEIDGLRAMLKAKIEPQIQAFPILPAQPLPPPPLPPEEATS